MLAKKSPILLLLAALAALAALAGCATLPSSGPTGRQVRRAAVAPKDGDMPLRLVPVRAAVDVPVEEAPTPSEALRDLAPPPTDMIGPGDVLDINIYEAGVSLFAGASTGTASQVSVDPGVRSQKLPPSRVDDQGYIVIPYAGRMRVAGRTINEVEGLIRASLRNLSQNPQVLVTLSQAITNSVIVRGEVARPGRLVLQTNRESLSDVIALSGGVRGDVKDLLLRVERGARNVDIRINDLVDHPELDVHAYPGDRLTLINDPRTFSVMGASGRVEQLPFTRSSVSVAEAVATAGGVNPNLGDPAAIFLFRYAPNEQSRMVPIVYHFNLMMPGTYFLAQRFTMRDKDVLYVGNAAANQPSKLVQLVSQLFSPILTATSAFQVLQNSR